MRYPSLTTSAKWLWIAKTHTPDFDLTVKQCHHCCRLYRARAAINNQVDMLVEALTNHFTDQVDESLKRKEAELMEV